MRIAAVLVMAVVATVALAAGCGSSGASPQPTATVTVTASATGTASPVVTPSPSPSPSWAATTTLSVYFMRPIGGAQPSHGPFVATAHRTLPATTTPATAAMTSLLAGPSSKERALGMVSAIPSGTTLRGLTISGGVATVDLSTAFGAGTQAGDAQVVYTLTQFPAVKTVVLKVAGSRLASAGGKRSDYEAVTPPIFVEMPAPFDRVSGVVKGTADVFEATFQAAIDADDGPVAFAKLQPTTVTATSGSGTRGTFSARVKIPQSVLSGLMASSSGSTPARLIVWDASAENGRPLHVVTIPLTLVSQPSQ